MIILIAFGLLAALLVYPVLMEALWGGRTVGKAMVGLRVVRTDGGPIGFGPAVVRGALGLLEVWFTLGSLGFLVMLISRRDQRLGDMAAGTLVLRDRRGPALQPVQLLVPPGCEQLVMTMDVAAMAPADYELVRSFLVRWREFPVQHRPAVASAVAGPLWQRFRHPIPSWLGPTTTWRAWGPLISTATRRARRLPSLPVCRGRAPPARPPVVPACRPGAMACRPGAMACRPVVGGARWLRRASGWPGRLDGWAEPR